MNLAPADYEAWSQATGQPYPSSAAERARVTPEVRAWKQQQLSAQQQPQERNALGDVLAPALGLLGVSAAGIGAYRHLRNRGATPDAAADMAVDVDKAVAATTPTAAPAARSAAQQEAIKADLEYNRAASNRSSNGPLLSDQVDEYGRPVRTLERYGRTGGDTAHVAGEYRNLGKGAAHHPDAAALVELSRTNPDAYAAALADARATMSGREYTDFVDGIQALASRNPINGIDPYRLTAGMDDMAKYGTTTNEAIKQAGGALSRTKSAASAGSNFAPPEDKPQTGKASVRTINGREIEGYDTSTNPFADLQRSEYSAQEGPMGETLHNSAQIQDAVIAANPQKTNESRTAYGLRIKGIIDSLATARTPKGPKVKTELDPKRGEVFYTDADGNVRLYEGPIAVDPKTGRSSTILKGPKQPIAWTDQSYYPTDDAYPYRQGAEMHPELTLDEVEINQLAKERTTPRFFDIEDQVIAGMQEPLSASDVEKGLATPLTYPDDDTYINMNRWEQQPDGTASRPRVLTFLEKGRFKSEPGRGPAAAGAALATAINLLEKQYGGPASKDEIQLLARTISREYNADPTSTIGAAAMRLAGANPAPGSREERILNAYNTASQATRERNAVAIGRTGQAPQANPVGLPYGRDQYTQTLAAIGLHAGADGAEMVDLVQSGNLKRAGEAILRSVPQIGSTVSNLLPKASADEVLNVATEGVMAGLSDLNTVLQRKPELAENFGLSKPGGFGVDAYLKSYVRQYTLLRGIDLADSPTYQVPNDSFELVMLERRNPETGAVDPLKAFEDFTTSRGSATRAVLDLDRLTSTSRSTVEIDPNRNATRLAETLFDLDGPEFNDLQARTLQNSLQGREIKINLASRLGQGRDATGGFYPTKHGRNPSERDLAEELQRFEEPTKPGSFLHNVTVLTGPDGKATGVSYNPATTPGRTSPYSVNSALMAMVKGADSDAAGFSAIRDDVNAKQQWLDDQGSFESFKAQFNRGLRPQNTAFYGPQALHSVGTGFALDASGRLVGSDSRSSLTLPEQVENDGGPAFDRRQDNQREDALIAPEDTDRKLLDEIADAQSSRALLTTPQKQAIQGEVGPQNLAALKSPEVQVAEGPAAEPLWFKSLGRTEGAASAGEAAAAQPFLQRYLADIQELRDYGAQREPLPARPVDFTGPRPGTPTEPWSPSKDTYSEPDGVDRSPEAVALRLQATEDDRLARLANVEARLAQAQAESAAGPTLVDFTQTQALPQSTSWSPQAPQAVNRPRQSVLQSTAGDIDQLQREAAELRARGPKPEGNLFGQLPETPRSAVTTTGSPVAAAAISGARNARAGGYGPTLGTPFSDSEGRVTPYTEGRGDRRPQPPLVIEGAAERAQQAEADSARIRQFRQDATRAGLSPRDFWGASAINSGNQMLAAVRPGSRAKVSTAAPSPALLQQLARVARSRGLV